MSRDLKTNVILCSDQQSLLNNISFFDGNDIVNDIAKSPAKMQPCSFVISDGKIILTVCNFLNIFLHSDPAGYYWPGHYITGSTRTISVDGEAF